MIAPNLTTRDLNGMIQRALDLDDAPDLDWERDHETGGWVVLWMYSEDACEVARWLERHGRVRASVSTGPRASNDSQPGCWLRVTERAS